MTKVKSLQLLVYIVFGLLVLDSAGKGAWTGFKEGYGDAMNEKGNSYRQGPPLHVALDGNYFTRQESGKLKIDDKYIVEDAVVNADVRVNHDKIVQPYVSTGLSLIVMFSMVIIISVIAINVNAIIKQIAEGSMFDWKCIKLIRRTGMLLLLYILADYGYQQLDYLQQVQQVHEPLKVINTATFDFTTLILVILIFIIAEAFKQGARLKEEQALVI
jgi:hypothetical protein